MSNFKFSFAACLCVAASMTAFGQNQGVGYLFQFSNPVNTTSPSQQFFGYIANANPLSPTIQANGPSGIANIIPKPDGSKFYLIGSSGTTAVQSASPTLAPPFTSINGLAAAPTAAAVTPDGRYLLIGADALYFIDTSSDQLVGSGLVLPGLPNFPADAPGYCATCWITFSRDSSAAYVLTNSPFGSQVTAFNTTNRQRIGTQLNLPFGGATSISMSPLGKLYVTAGNRIYVVDPATVTLAQEIDLAFTPTQLQYTPDGKFAYTVNQNPAIGGRSILQLNLTNGNIATWPSQSTGQIPPTFDSIYVVSNDRLFAYSSALGYLFDVTSSLTVTGPATSLSVPASVVQNVLAVAVSKEVPSAQYLFLLVSNGNYSSMYRMNLTTNQIDPGSGSAQVAALSGGIMEYTVVPPETGASTILQFNDQQILQPGTTSVPLLVRVVNQLGQAIYNIPVTYTTDSSSGTVITAPGQLTNSDGYAQTTITAPTTPGTYTITATAGTVAASFTFTVPCTGTGCTTGTGPGTSSQVTMVSGDGQLLQAFYQPSIDDPLTVLVTDTNGKPLVNVPVTFTVTSGNVITLNNPNATTDATGMAKTSLVAQPLPPGVLLQANTVTATASVGSVYFTETVFNVNTDQTGFPQFALLAPTLESNSTVTLPAGSSLASAIVASIYSGANPVAAPIPGVGILVANAGNPSVPPPAYCGAGSTNSDSQTGIARCTLVAGCQTGVTGLTVLVGNNKQYNIAVNITAGGASHIAISSGNNQTGKSGDVLQPLIAAVTNGCGTPVSGAGVTWSIVQGSATLVRTVNTTDSTGLVSTGITFGQTPGTVMVKATLAGSTSITFTLTNQILISSLTLSSGSGQTTAVGTPFPQPVIFVAKDASGNPLSGVVVSFTITGSGTLSAASGTTNSAGQVSANVTAGSTTGTATVTASAGSFSATASLTVQPVGPSITASSFQNSASFQVGLVPCGLGTVIGNGIAPGVPGVVSGLSAFGPLSLQVAGFSLAINGVSAPISSVSNQNGVQQATFQTPCETAPGSATAVVTVNGVPTTITGVQVYSAQPGIFTFQGANGKAYGAVIRALDGSYVTPSTPAHRGETYYLVVTGLGQTTPAATTNNTGTANQNVNAQLVVGVNNAGVAVTSAQYAVGLIGVYLVGFQIPLANPTGTDLPLAVATIVNGQVSYGNSVFLPGVN